MSKLTAHLHDLFAAQLFWPLVNHAPLPSAYSRSVRRAFIEGLYFRRASAEWGIEEKQRWTLSRLREIVRRAYRESVYYRELFNRIGFEPQSDFGFEEFSKLPILERDNIHQAGEKLISDAVRPDWLHKISTGGSTGIPTQIRQGPEERGWCASANEYFMQRIGAPKGTRTGLLWGHHLDPVASDRLRDRCKTFINNARWFDCFRLSPEILDKYHHEFQRWQPTCITAYASALGQLAEYVLEQGYKPNYPTLCFVTGAEKLVSKHREYITKAFGRPVHERYGGRDVPMIAFQLEPTRQPDYTIDWANYLVEPETEEDDSEILITKLHADGMPMIRYRIGDVGRFAEGNAPGNPAFTLHEILGRSTDRIWVSEGRWIHGNQLPHLLKDYPVREFVFIQHANYSVDLQLIPRSGFDDGSRKSILQAVESSLPGLNVTITLVDNIPRTKANKWRPVMSEVKLS